MKMFLPPHTFVFVLMFAFAAPQSTLADVKIGAGNIKTFTSPAIDETGALKETPTVERPEKRPTKAGPLARSTAELFRKEVTELKEALIEKSLTNIPKSNREAFRKDLGKEINVEKILARYALTLEQYYTEDELKALRTFMANPINRGMLEKLPAVLGQLGLDRQNYLNNVLENFLQRELFDKLEKGEPTILTPQ